MKTDDSTIAAQLIGELAAGRIGQREFWLATLVHSVSLQFRDSESGDIAANDVQRSMREMMGRCALAYIGQERLDEDAVTAAVDLLARGSPVPGASSIRPRYLS